VTDVSRCFLDLTAQQQQLTTGLESRQMPQ
jgi:hypothetical protein